MFIVSLFGKCWRTWLLYFFVWNVLKNMFIVSLFGNDVEEHVYRFLHVIPTVLKNMLIVFFQVEVMCWRNTCLLFPPGMEPGPFACEANVFIVSLFGMWLIDTMFIVSFVWILCWRTYFIVSIVWNKLPEEHVYWISDNVWNVLSEHVYCFTKICLESCWSNMFIVRFVKRMW